jgi:hypothetical protein
MPLRDNNSGGCDSLPIPVVLLGGSVSTLAGMLVRREGADVPGLGLTVRFGTAHVADTLSLMCFSPLFSVV